MPYTRRAVLVRKELFSWRRDGSSHGMDKPTRELLPQDCVENEPTTSPRHSGFVGILETGTG